MSMKNLPLKKHNCFRERCQGQSKDYQNYLDIPPSHQKKNIKRPKTTRSQHSINQILPKKSKIKTKSKSKLSPLEKSEVEELKRKNQENQHKNSQLADQLQSKSRRIHQLKLKLKDYELKMQNYDQRVNHLQSLLNDNEHPQSPSTYSPQSEQVIASYQQQIQSFQHNQKLMLQHMQKFRTVQRQYQNYRFESERKMQKLLRQNQQLRQLETHQKDYDGQIDILRKELHKMSVNTQDKTSSVTEQEIFTLKTSNRQLLSERQHLLLKIQEQAIKEGDLRRSLEAINMRVERWSDEYKIVIQEKRKAEERCKQLQRRLQHKKQKHQDEKQEWAKIFRDLMLQVEKLKKEMHRLQRSNKKLMDLYSQNVDQ